MIEYDKQIEELPPIKAYVTVDRCFVGVANDKIEDKAIIAFVAKPENLEQAREMTFKDMAPKVVLAFDSIAGILNLQKVLDEAKNALVEKEAEAAKIPEWAVADYEKFEAFVKSMPVNVRRTFPDNFYYSSIIVEQSERYEGRYFWTMGANFKVSGYVNTAMPLKGNYIQTFKQEWGAKQNLLKHIKFVFERKKRREADNG